MSHEHAPSPSTPPTPARTEGPTLLSSTPVWMYDAACRGLDLGVVGDLFFPEHGTGQGSTAARRICATCSVRTDCAEYAIDNRIWHGIWGGMSTRSRRRIAAERERLAS